MRSAMSRTDVGDGAGVQGERQQRPAGVVPAGGHLHLRRPRVRGTAVIVRDRLHASGCEVDTVGVPDRKGRRERVRATEGEAAWGIIRSSPTTAGRASRTWSRRCSSRGRSRLPGSRRPRSRPTRCVLLVLDGLGWDQLQARRHLAPTLCGHGRRADRQRRPVHHRHRPHVDRHRPHAGRARRGRLPGRGRRRGAEHPALVDARRATPAGASTPTGSSPTPPSAASGRRS